MSNCDTDSSRMLHTTMKAIATLVLMLVCFASTAIADRSSHIVSPFKNTIQNDLKQAALLGKDQPRLWALRQSSTEIEGLSIDLRQIEPVDPETMVEQFAKPPLFFDTVTKKREITHLKPATALPKPIRSTP